MGSLDINCSEEVDTLIPEGTECQLLIASSENKISKKSGDEYVNAMVQVVSGKYAGESFFAMFNLWSSNPMAKKIARREVAKIGSACGVAVVSEFEQLLNKPFWSKVGVQVSAGYDPKNTIGERFVKQMAPVVAPKPADKEEFQDDIFG